MIRVERAGLWTSVQDRGRFGWRHVGMPTSGMMDTFAGRVANMLVGNRADEALLEMTIDGPTLVFDCAAVISLCGGAFTLEVDDVVRPMWQAVRVEAGARIRIGAAMDGYRAYLAVAGGIAVPEVLGSRSMYARAHGFAALAGRVLVAGDELPLCADGAASADAVRLAASMAKSRWTVTSRMRPYPVGVGQQKRVRCFAGAEHARFSADAHTAFTAEPYVLSAQADRMGLRLQGRGSLYAASGGTQPSAASAPSAGAAALGSMPSAPAAVGNVQVPPHGLPIVLAADGQTIGGYPRIAQVAAVDMPLLAQARPGEAIHFQWISADEAEQLWHQRELDFALLQLSLDTLRG